MKITKKLEITLISLLLFGLLIATSYAVVHLDGRPLPYIVINLRIK